MFVTPRAMGYRLWTSLCKLNVEIHNYCIFVAKSWCRPASLLRFTQQLTEAKVILKESLNSLPQGLQKTWNMKNFSFSQEGPSKFWSSATYLRSKLFLLSNSAFDARPKKNDNSTAVSLGKSPLQKNSSSLWWRFVASQTSTQGKI